jgi:hypothetical protein
MLMAPKEEWRRKEFWTIFFPFVLIWLCMVIILIICVQELLWRKSFLSLDQFKELINMIRGVNAVATVGGQS